MVKPLAYFLILAFMSSCESGKEQNSWNGGRVESPGSYHYNPENLTLNVTLENGLVRYELIDSLGNSLLKTREDVSGYQKWALFLDADESLWVLSSDIGNAWWKRDTETQRYTYTKIDHLFDRSSIPPSVYSELKDFFR